MAKEEYPIEIPFNRHKDCQTLTELTIEHLPHDGSLGRKLQHRKNSFIWHADDRQDKIYFLEKGQVAISFIDSKGHEAIVQNVEAGNVFGELCFKTNKSQEICGFERFDKFEISVGSLADLCGIDGWQKVII